MSAQCGWPSPWRTCRLRGRVLAGRSGGCPIGIALRRFRGVGAAHGSHDRLPGQPGLAVAVRLVATVSRLRMKELQENKYQLTCTVTMFHFVLSLCSIETMQVSRFQRSAA